MDLSFTYDPNTKLMPNFIMKNLLEKYSKNVCLLIQYFVLSKGHKAKI